ncbi:MAG: ornithine acetyltransferase, partial [Armatimonadota bacterium]
MRNGVWSHAAPDRGRPAIGEATILGVAKGSGMIAPNMATMFGFVLTDLDLSALDADALWRSVCDRTFNSVTVDTDTSTNDMAILIASGTSGIALSLADAEVAIGAVAESLARQIARDGEGAT